MLGCGDHEQRRLTDAPLSAERAGLAEGSAAAAGGNWKLIGQTAHGEPCARATAPTATPSVTFPSTTRAHAPTVGGRTAWQASAIASSASVSRSRSWNGRDPILKERIFGLGGAGAQSRRGRQGILVVSRRHADLLLTTLALSLSTSQFPYARLRQENANRTRDRPGIRASRRWRVRRRSILANHCGLRQGGTG